jgi:hypothetical protein
MDKGTAADRDTPQLSRMATDRLLKEVAFLTVKINAADPARLRRDRAFRILRERNVPRVDIAKVAHITPGAVKNLIDALNRREAQAEPDSATG